MGRDPGVFVDNMASLPQKGQLTARAKFHRDPIALPPLIKNEKEHNYYRTGVKEHYSEVALPSFNKPSGNGRG